MCRALSTSIPVVGSSRKRISGSWMMPAAMVSLRRMPLEYALNGRSGFSQIELLQKLPCPPLPGCLGHAVKRTAEAEIIKAVHFTVEVAFIGYDADDGLCPLGISYNINPVDANGAAVGLQARSSYLWLWSSQRRWGPAGRRFLPTDGK